MLKRQVFYSFHFGKDSWRAGQVRKIGAIQGNTPVSSNEWEEVKRQGEQAIKNWINRNMSFRSCIIVLIGIETAKRPWIQYEIKRAWKEGKGIVGIHIHNLKDKDGNQSNKGDNPFELFHIDKTMNYITQNSTPADRNEISLARVCKTYIPPYILSKNVYDYIQNNISSWVEEAIKIRNQYPK